MLNAYSHCEERSDEAVYLWTDHFAQNARDDTNTCGGRNDCGGYLKQVFIGQSC